MPPKVNITTPDSRGTSLYRSSLRAAIRGLWLGVMDPDQFWKAMSLAIKTHLRAAWLSGAKECGIAPDELTTDEVMALQDAIDYEHIWIGGLANTIEANSKARGGKLTPLLTRIEIWIGRWEGVRSKALTMACKDKKLEWVLGPTEHCRSCLALSGKVKRASWWNENGILPRVHGAWYLICKGFRCACQIRSTDKPLSRGRMPRLP